MSYWSINWCEAFKNRRKASFRASVASFHKRHWKSKKTTYKRRKLSSSHLFWHAQTTKWPASVRWAQPPADTEKSRERRGDAHSLRYLTLSDTKHLWFNDVDSFCWVACPWMNNNFSLTSFLQFKPAFPSDTFQFDQIKHQKKMKQPQDNLETHWVSYEDVIFLLMVIDNFSSITMQPEIMTSSNHSL